MNRAVNIPLALALATWCFAGCDSTPRTAPGALPDGETGSQESEVSGDVLPEVLGDPDAYARARRLATLLPALGPEAVPQAKEILEDPRRDLDAAVFELLVRFWSSHAPAEATQWALERRNLIHLQISVPVAVERLAEADPQAALQVVRAATVSRNQAAGAAQWALVQGWYASDVEGVEEYIRDRGYGVERQRLLSAYARELILDRGAEAATRWAESVPEDDSAYKLDVYRQLTNALALFDMQTALRWCEAQCEGPFGDGLRTLIARRRLVDEGGSAALEWLSGAPEGDEKKNALRIIFANWGVSDPEEALAWMEARVGGPTAPEPWVRHLYSNYAGLLAKTSPSEAIQWAQRIEDDQERETTLVHIIRLWRGSDADAAEAWLAQSSLSEKAREQARLPLPRRGNRAQSPNP